MSNRARREHTHQLRRRLEPKPDNMLMVVIKLKVPKRWGVIRGVK